MTAPSREDMMLSLQDLAELRTEGGSPEIDHAGSSMSHLKKSPSLVLLSLAFISDLASMTL